MSHFVDRKEELAILEGLHNQDAAQFVMVHGRRRVGKTTLLLHFAEQSGLPVLYWIAGRDTPEVARQSLARVIWNWAHGEGNVAPRFSLWEEVFEMAAQVIGSQPVIFIMDEFPDAVHSDPSLPSHLRAAWDRLFKNNHIMLALCGSHIGMMVDLNRYDAPLYGRFTHRFLLEPLPFHTLRDFLPRYDLEEQVAVNAVLGGIPAYLERWDDQKSVGTNIKQLLFKRAGMFQSDPFLLISDVVRRETQTYEIVLKAVAAGHHTPSDISKSVGLSSSHISPYLKRLVELYLLERRVPATIPPAKWNVTNISRYYLRDPYLRFYFHFIEPNKYLVEQGLTNRLWEKVSAQFRSFVALTFEELCRTWTLHSGQAGQLPLGLDVVGTHWSPRVQIDVVAVDWQTKQILLGECKWGEGQVGRKVITDLIENRAPKAIADLPNAGCGWTAYYAFFARTGFSEAAIIEASRHQAILRTLPELYQELLAMSKPQSP